MGSPHSLRPADRKTGGFWIGSASGDCADAESNSGILHSGNSNKPGFLCGPAGGHGVSSGASLDRFHRRVSGTQAAKAGPGVPIIACGCGGRRPRLPTPRGTTPRTSFTLDDEPVAPRLAHGRAEARVASLNNCGFRIEDFGLRTPPL